MEVARIQLESSACFQWVSSPERDEAKVGPVEEAPSLPLREEERAAADVRDHHRYRHRDRHGDVVQRLRIIVLRSKRG